MSHEDGTYFKENPLSATGELRLSLILYVDDIKLVNPLGTARKIGCSPMYQVCIGPAFILYS